jgi:hypothetical protein
VAPRGGGAGGSARPAGGAWPVVAQRRQAHAAL